MYLIQVDIKNHLLDITTSGFWNSPEATLYSGELRSRARLLRESSGRVRAIINALDSPVQSSEVMSIVGNAWSELLTGSNDRVALMVESSLAKMQAKRLFTSDHWKAFFCPTAARTWLSV